MTHALNTDPPGHRTVNAMASAGAAAQPADEHTRTGGEILSGLARGLLGLPYEQRGLVLAHLIPCLTAAGAPPQALAGFDPTDANLQGVCDACQGLGQQSPGAAAIAGGNALRSG